MLIFQFFNFLTVPSAEPQDCMNSSYSSSSVTLQWSRIPNTEYNGLALGYNITCWTSNAHSDEVFTSTNTITIAGLTPFSSYVCNLSAVNEIGQGPSTQCFFTTEQDSKIHTKFMHCKSFFSFSSCRFTKECVTVSIIPILSYDHLGASYCS